MGIQFGPGGLMQRRNGGIHFGPVGQSNPEETMFTGLAVNADGWTLDATILDAKDGGAYSGLNDNSAHGLMLQVRSKSWTDTGVETTLSRIVFATSVIRKPSPDGTELQETENGSDLGVVFSLSSEIFAGDTIVSASFKAAFFTNNGAGGDSGSNRGGSATISNNSTLAYKEPQALWLTGHEDRITADWKPRLLVGHRYAQQGQPVRAVKFTITDQSSNSVTAIASALTTGLYSASGFHENWFEPSWDITGLADGDKPTIDAVIYPWVGDAYTISLNGDAYPSPNISVLQGGVVDTSGTYGEVIAYVNPNAVGPGTASTDDATSAADPFTTVSLATSAAIAVNNSTYGRNNLSGVTIKITAGVTVTGLGGSLSSLAEGDLPLLIEGANRTTSIFATEDSATNRAIPGKLKVKNLTMRKVGATRTVFYGKNQLANQLVFEDVDFDLNGTAKYYAWLWRTGRMYFMNCGGDNCGQGDPLGSYIQGAALVAGCTFLPGSPYNIAATDAVLAYTFSLGTILGTPKGVVLSNSFLRANVDTFIPYQIGATDLGSRGAAILGSVLEGYGAQISKVLSISADTDTQPVENINCAHLTVKGGRVNIAYDDTGTTAHLKDVVFKHCVVEHINMKSDYFAPASGNRTGNWAIRHGVNCTYNFIDFGDSGGATTPLYSAWLGEGLGDAKNEMPVGTVVTGNPDFADDQSNTGGDAGNGDYTPGASTVIPFIPAGKTVSAVDYRGRTIASDGTALAGAVQKAA